MPLDQSAKSKKAWVAPRLTVHGTVEKITQTKQWGFNDGYISSVDVNGPIQGTISGPIGGTKGTDPTITGADFSFTPRFS